MPSLIQRVTQFARSPKGRELTHKAQSYAKSPEGKRKIDEARQRLGKKR